MRSAFKAIPILILLIVMQGPLLGQADRATIGGTVADPTGAVLPGVDVVAVNVDTGVQTVGLTNEVGNYSLPNLPIGTYRLTFSLPGFKTYERTDFRVTTGQRARLDVVLDIGELTELVTISASSELLESDNPMVAQTMQSEVLTDLPLSFAGGRAIENFAYAVTPGVEGNNWTSHIAGGQSFSKEVLIDGISATSQIQGHVGESSPTMEAVQEFKVQTSSVASAEYGRTLGGIFQFALKTGTNDFHGSAFYYTRNEALNANTWMNNWNASQHPDDDRFKRARDRQNLLGGSAGGPVIIPGLYNGRDRTFVFGAFEHFEQSRFEIGPMNKTVPIPAFLSGDFSRLLTNEVVGQDALGRDVYAGAIYDPATRRTVDGHIVADPFPGNIIPSDRISSVSNQIAGIFRSGYTPMVSDRLTNNAGIPRINSPWFHQTQLTLKADHAVSDVNKFSGSLIWTQRPRILVDQGGIWDPSSEPSGGPLANSRKQEVTSRRATLSNNWTASPTLINTFNVSYNRYNNPSLSLEFENGWPQQLGLHPDAAGNFPVIQFGSSVNGVWTERIGQQWTGRYIANTYIVSDSVNWISGSHNFRFGGEFWIQQMNSHDATQGPLSFNYSNQTTGIPGESWTNRIGFGFASFLLGEVDSANRGVPFDLYGRRNYWAVYFQDDFKVNQKLTLNLGLRWEQPQGYYEKYGRWANFNPNLTNTDLGIPGALEFAEPGQTFEGDRDWSQLAPRIGLAYRVSDRLVLRGGYGIFYLPPSLQYWGGVPYSFAPGYRGTDRIDPLGQGTPIFSWDDAGYPGNPQPPTQDPNFVTWGMVAIDENSLQSSYTHQYNASVQWSFTADDMVEFTFMGNKGRQLHSGHLRRNQATRAAYEAAGVDPFAWVWDEGSAAAAGVPYPYPGFSGQAGFALQPFPQVANTWGPLFYVGSPLGSSAYRSFQVNFTRRMSAGLAANASYSNSRTTGNVEDMFAEPWWVGVVQDVYNLDQEAKNVVGYDRTHVFKGLASWELPLGRGQRWLADSSGVVDAVLGGWTVTGIFRYESGVPLGIGANVWRPGWEGAVYADVVGPINTVDFNRKGFDPGNPSDPVNRYFDPSAFASPGGHALGNGARLYEDLRGFGGAYEDLGIMKYWSLGETARLQFRFEALNIFNRHYFQNPQTGLGAGEFGNVVTTGGEPRNMQVGLRLHW